MERIGYISFFFCALCGASLIKTPINKAVIAGQRMEMECRTDNGSIFRKWDFLQAGNKSPRAIAANDNKNIEIPPTISGYSVDVDGKGSVTLYSNSTETKDAGVYICQVETLSGSTEFKYSAQLIVFETKPFCETNLTANSSFSDGDCIQMQCRVNFRGNWAPTMEWRQHEVNADNDEGSLISNGTNSVVIHNSSITSTLIVLIDPTNYDSYFSCRTYFIWHNGKLRTNATNVPNFQHTWTSTSTTHRISRPTTFCLTDWPTISIDTTAKSRPTIENTDETRILLITGICLLVCILIVATVGVAYCVLHNRKATAAKESIKPIEVLASEYDLIPYACTDGYDTIEEAEEKDVILLTNFPQRHGPLPTPGYSGLMSDEPKPPPGDYSIMDHQETSVDKEKRGNNPQSGVERSTSDHPSLSDVGETTVNATNRVNSYLDLTMEIAHDIVAEGEEIPSAYLKKIDDSVQINTDSNVLETLQKEDSCRKQELCSYLELLPESDRGTAECSEEMPSAYLKL